MNRNRYERRIRIQRTLTLIRCFYTNTELNDSIHAWLSEAA